MNNVAQICLVVLAISMASIALVQVGVIKPAHAISLNGAIRLLKIEIIASEERLVEKIEESCVNAD